HAASVVAWTSALLVVRERRGLRLIELRGRLRDLGARAIGVRWLAFREAVGRREKVLRRDHGERVIAPKAGRVVMAERERAHPGRRQDQHDREARDRSALAPRPLPRGVWMAWKGGAALRHELET